MPLNCYVKQVHKDSSDSNYLVSVSLVQSLYRKFADCKSFHVEFSVQLFNPNVVVSITNLTARNISW
jgi:hypothetical protein